MTPRCCQRTVALDAALLTDAEFAAFNAEKEAERREKEGRNAGQSATVEHDDGVEVRL